MICETCRFRAGSERARELWMRGVVLPDDVSYSHTVKAFYCLFAAAASNCPGRRPVCTTCLYASNPDSCSNEGYQDDCSAMTDVSPAICHYDSNTSLFDN